MLMENAIGTGREIKRGGRERKKYRRGCDRESDKREKRKREIKIERGR
jgi:hypothetical protein